ncbi:TetR/AcrR family transcriptional regulator [Frankia canadensis]|uniref:TetR/AcrR family transcriptional regulator n=1 Tax=Frankia canadensis TaxID=1836972 RepID=UPI000C7C64D1|nr:TetR/AcrR family transcriptional regulator [Frankia canadensis]
MSGPTGTRPRRSDARANRDRLLAQARQAFAEHGIDTSLEGIARQAGVGIGTFYRHFPSREALLEAVLHDRFDLLTRRAQQLSAMAAPEEALIIWLREFLDFASTYRGLTAALARTLRDADSDLHAACTSMRGAGASLVTAAQGVGALRRDLGVLEVFTLVTGIAWAFEQSSCGAPGPLAIDRVLALALDGLRGPAAAEDPAAAPR